MKRVLKPVVTVIIIVVTLVVMGFVNVALGLTVNFDGPVSDASQIIAIASGTAAIIVFILVTRAWVSDYFNRRWRRDDVKEG